MKKKTAEAAAKKHSPVSQRRAILVLGMHRSGTSALTRTLGLLGATLPRHLLGANPTNPAGHWEPELLVNLHDRMFKEAGSRWDDWRAFDPGVLAAERLAHYRGEFGRVIAEDYGDAPLIVIKDPRICRFVPLYESILEEMDIAAHYVITQRNPLAVIASLGKRDGMTPGFAGLLWLRHTLDAGFSTRGLPRVFLSYEDFLDDWRQAERRIAKDLSLAWPHPVEEAAAEIDSHLDRGLQHHAPAWDDLEADLDVARWIKDAYGAYLKLVAKRDDKKALATLDSIKEEFDSASDIFGKASFPELKSREQRLRQDIRVVRQQMETGKREADKLQHNLANALHQIEAGKGEMDDMSRKLAAKDERIGTPGTKPEKMDRGMEALVGELTQLREHFTEQEKRARADVRRLTGANRQLEQQVAALQHEIAATRTEIDDSKAGLVRAQTQVALLQRELDDEKQTFLSAHEQLQRQDVEIARLTAEKAEHDAEMANLRGTNADYQALAETLERDRDHAREVLDAVYARVQTQSAA